MRAAALSATNQAPSNPPQLSLIPGSFAPKGDRPSCPYCGGTPKKQGKRRGKQRWQCQECSQWFESEVQ